MNTLANSFGSQTDYASFANRRFLYFQPRNQLIQAGYLLMKIIAALLTLFTAIFTNAFADDQGFYTNIDSGIHLYSNAPKGNSIGIRFGGGYHFNSHFGVEAGYSLIQDSSSGDCVTYVATLTTCPQDTLSASSSQVAVVGTMSNGLFVKLGWATTSLGHSYSYTPCFLVFCDATVTGSGSATKTNPMFGFGWQSAVDQHSYWRVQYENLGTVKLTTNYNIQPSTTSDIGIQVISVGYVFNF